MNPDERRKQSLKDLLDQQKLAVLGTHREGQPYGSLVSFAATPDMKQILFATTRSTRKYENLTADARVSLLIDNRSNQDSDIHEATAVTATGRADELDEADRERFLELYLDKHPYLRDFVNSPTCALLRVRVETYYLVNRFQEVTELHAEKWT
jgi:nitroimidazol reductase NimA-like FMN-containing flavoprotein (pyridoxamine 5'-phosphate oxidase superfamily)